MSSQSSQIIVPHRVGGWLPQDHTIARRYVDDILKKARELPKDTALAPSILALKALIEDRTNHLDIWIGFHQMFDEIPNKYPYTLNSMMTGKQIRDYNDMLNAFNVILTTPPKYENNDLVAFPFNVILDWPMGTASGYSMFLNKFVNEKLVDIINAYARYLADTNSNSKTVLIPHQGYLADPSPELLFYQLYKCPNKDAPHYGFRSFDEWFTREFNTIEKWRPVAGPTDDSVITSACESQVYRIRHALQNDTFWLKGQPYSLQDMLYDDELAPQFETGLVYQAFLSAAKYHRWNSPVNGKIRKVVQVPGYPYAESYYEGFANINSVTGEPDPDPAATDRSQAFITSVATRALVFIDATDKDIGLMCFIAVGMSEVSSCPVHPKWKPGVTINKGDEIGMFHFGGSTHCLIFRQGVNINFNVKEGVPVLINSKIGTVVKGQ